MSLKRCVWPRPVRLPRYDSSPFFQAGLGLHDAQRCRIDVDLGLRHFGRDVILDVEKLDVRQIGLALLLADLGPIAEAEVVELPHRLRTDVAPSGPLVQAAVGAGAEDAPLEIKVGRPVARHQELGHKRTQSFALQANHVGPHHGAIRGQLWPVQQADDDQVVDAPSRLDQGHLEMIGLERHDHRARVEPRHARQIAASTRAIAAAPTWDDCSSSAKSVRARSISSGATSPRASVCTRRTTSSALVVASVIAAYVPRDICTLKYDSAVISSISLRAVCVSIRRAASTCRAAKGSKMASADPTAQDRTAAGDERIGAVDQQAAIRILNPARVPDVGAPHVQIRQPQHIRFLCLRGGNRHAGLRRRNHERPPVRQPSRRGQVDRQRSIAGHNSPCGRTPAGPPSDIRGPVITWPGAGGGQAVIGIAPTCGTDMPCDVGGKRRGDGGVDCGCPTGAGTASTGAGGRASVTTCPATRKAGHPARTIVMANVAQHHRLISLGTIRRQADLARGNGEAVWGITDSLQVNSAKC